jgi:hypothetical protein
MLEKSAVKNIWMYKRESDKIMEKYYIMKSFIISYCAPNIKMIKTRIMSIVGQISLKNGADEKCMQNVSFET